MAHDTTTITGRLTDALYTEAMLLADELRAYLDGPGAELRGDLPPAARVLFACETLNATTRLMQVVARLLARRAGERGDGLEDLAPPSVAALDQLPVEAQRLIGAGVELYERVRRLDVVAVAVPAAPSPARALLHRLERSL